MGRLNQTLQLQLKDTQGNYFVRMMLPDAEKRVKHYVKEEKTSLLGLMSSLKDLDQKNFIVIGSGTIWYIELVYGKVKNYIAVEPLANVFIQKQMRFILSKHKNIKIIGQDFGNFQQSDLPDNNSIFVFHFNILSYIPEPIKNINKYLKSGDILYISTWSKTEKAKRIRKEYFDYINQGMLPTDFKIDPDKPIGLCNLDSFPFKKLRYYKSHNRIKGDITDVLIINC